MIRPKFIFSALSGLVLVIALTFLAPVVVEKVIAQTGTKTLSNYAWSSNIGWIQMDTGQNPVVVSSDGNFSGYGWSSNVGWLQFNPTGPYPATPNHAVKIDFTQNPYKMSGWGRFLANGGGWDGWVNFDGVTYNPSTKKFTGYAWGSTVVGWVDMSTVVADLTASSTPDCSDPTYAAANPEICISDPPNDCSNPTYAAAHPEICDTDEEFTLTLNCLGGIISYNEVVICNNKTGVTEDVDEGEFVELSVSAITGYEFNNWTGSCLGTDPDCSFIMNGNKVVSAVFSSINEPVIEPFTIENGKNSCRSSDSSLCRITIDCSTTDECRDGYYSTRKAIIRNNVADTAAGLDITVSSPPVYANFLSTVLCTDETFNNCNGSSLSGYSGANLYVRIRVDLREIGEQRVFDFNLISPASADHAGKTETIRGSYQDPVIVTPNSAKSSGQ